MMKNVIAAGLLSVSFAVAALGGASAQYVGGQQAQGQRSVTTVAEVLKNGFDEQRVTLRGQIVRRIQGDKYVFADGTGQIRVDIDEEEWPNEPVNDKTTVEITGKVDIDYGERTEIDVKVLRIVK